MQLLVLILKSINVISTIDITTRGIPHENFWKGLCLGLCGQLATENLRRRLRVLMAWIATYHTHIPSYDPWCVQPSWYHPHPYVILLQISLATCSNGGGAPGVMGYGKFDLILFMRLLRRAPSCKSSVLWSSASWLSLDPEILWSSSDDHQHTSPDKQFTFSMLFYALQYHTQKGTDLYSEKLDLRIAGLLSCLAGICSWLWLQTIKGCKESLTICLRQISNIDGPEGFLLLGSFQEYHEGQACSIAKSCSLFFP